MRMLRRTDRCIDACNPEFGNIGNISYIKGELNMFENFGTSFLLAFLSNSLISIGIANRQITLTTVQRMNE